MDLTRYATDPFDESIATVIRDLAKRDHAAWQAQQALLTERDSYTLLVFADRRAALALRTRRSEFAYEGVQALSLLNSQRVDPRDRTAAFPLYALRETGGEVAAALAFAVSRSDAGMRRYFPNGRVTTKLTLSGCGLVEVHSRHGLGFLQTWGRPAPRHRDLPAYAVAIADRLEETTEYDVELIHLSDLPRVWFGIPNDRGIDLRTHGCVSLSAGLRGAPRGGHGLIVFLAEMDDSATARAVADLARGASKPDATRGAKAVGSLLFLVIGRSRARGVPSVESDAALTGLATDLVSAAGLTIAHIARPS